MVHCGITRRLLRRHIGWSAKRDSGLRQGRFLPSVGLSARVGQRFRDAEIGNNRGVVSEKHIRRFDVAVDDANAVSVRERPGDVAKHIDGVHHRNPFAVGKAAKSIRERFSLDERHCVVGTLTDSSRGEDWHDVRMLQPRQQLHLTRESLSGELV